MGVTECNKEDKIERKDILLIGRHVGIESIPERNEAAIWKEKEISRRL